MKFIFFLETERLSIINEVESLKDNKQNNNAISLENYMKKRVSEASNSEVGKVKTLLDFKDIPFESVHSRNEKIPPELAYSQPIKHNIIESPIAKPWRIIKATLFSLIEYNGEYSDVISEIKKSLRKKFKTNFGEISKKITSFIQFKINRHKLFFLNAVIF